jgi:hypothetical protein
MAIAVCAIPMPSLAPPRAIGAKIGRRRSVEQPLGAPQEDGVWELSKTRYKASLAERG